MVTALTYQFQGWLAALMSNPRRRNTIIVMLTMSFVLLCQLPNLLNTTFMPKLTQAEKEETSRVSREKQEIRQLLDDKKITSEEYQQRQEKIDTEGGARFEKRVEQVAWIVNMALPPGWLPLGAGAIAAGEYLLPLLCTFGMALIGTASLWRSYRTTIRIYRGEFTGGRKKPAEAAPVTGTRSVLPRLLEAKLPWLSEQAAAVALASFRGFMRTPEAKMMLMSPLLMIVIFGGMMLSGRMHVPDVFRPLLPYGVVAMILISMVQFVANQFGFDRSGFRVFVLCRALARTSCWARTWPPPPSRWA